MNEDDLQYGALDQAKDQETAARTPARGGRVHWRLEQFLDLIEHQGQRLLWQQSIRCACRWNSQTDQANPLCDICSGTGREFFGARIIRGVIENVTVDIDPVNEYGIYYRGMSRLTVRPEHPVGYRDRITMLDAVADFEEVVTRDELRRPGPVFRMRYRIVPRMVELIDVETNKPVLHPERVIRCRTWAQDGTTNLLREHTDFDVWPDGRLDMTKAYNNGRGPAEGERFAIKYNMNPTWIVTALEPQYLRTQRDEQRPQPEDLVAFPRTVMMGVDFIVHEGDED